jgi:hypothetical protein
MSSAVPIIGRQFEVDFGEQAAYRLHFIPCISIVV